jgi:hypothetical protein
MVRKSLRACSRERAESHEMSAKKKKAKIAVEFGVTPANSAKYTTITLLMLAKIKLLTGDNIWLEIAIVTMKTKRERPFASCSGVSLKAEIIVRNNKQRRCKSARISIKKVDA